MMAIQGLAQTGAITEEMLEKFREGYNDDGHSKAAMNAASANSIRNIVTDRENLYFSDTYFTHRVESSGITDQKSTGRCWLFTGLNVLRAKIMEKHDIGEFMFSHNYNFFFDQLEKANLFLEEIIATAGRPMDDKKVEWLFKHPIGDGGQWTGVADIIEKYGVVPAEVFPESHNSENTSMMRTLIRRKLRENGLEIREMHEKGKDGTELRDRKEEMLNDVYRILAITLGEPPAKFSWRYKMKSGKVTEMKEYTPLSFYTEFVGVDLDDYVMFMNDPSRDYNTLYEIENDRHLHEGKNWKYINLETGKIKEFAVQSIMDNEAMYFSCDVGKQLDRDRGVLDIENFDYEALFGVQFGMDKKDRIRTFESGSSHGMALVAVDLDDQGQPRKWLLENSWGDKGFNGHLIMTDRWFDEYMFRLVVNKKHVDEQTLEILETEPVLLPPWDPMFAPDH